MNVLDINGYVYLKGQKKQGLRAAMKSIEEIYAIKEGHSLSEWHR